jgi:outer membrane receptor protein involved in Fe transport
MRRGRRAARRLLQQRGAAEPGAAGADIRGGGTDGDREGEFGNPDLDPYEAFNFDASVEWYFADASVLSAGVFYKDIENFIFNTEFRGG